MTTKSIFAAVGLCLFLFQAAPLLAQTTQTGPLPYTLPSCTAQDAGSVSVSNVQVAGTCASPSDSVDVSFDYSFFTNADRYDFRLGLTTPDSGVEKVFLQGCAHTLLGVTPDNPPIDAGGSGIFDNIDGDNDCGDVYSSTPGTSGTVNFTVSCDPLGKGAVDPNLQVSPALDWVQRTGDNKGWQFEAPKCKLGDGDGLARFTIPTAAAITSISKISNGGTGTFGYFFSNAEINSTVGGNSSSITTTSAGVAASDGVEFVVQDLAQPVVLTESVPAGWVVSDISCSLDNGSSVGTFAPTSASLTIPAGALTIGDLVSCTITNALPNDPTLTLRKTVNNTDGGTAVVGDFALSYTDGGVNNGSGVSGSTPVTNVILPAGTYTISEMNLANYTGSLSCAGALDTDPSNGLTLVEGDTAVCTFTNTYSAAAAAALAIEKRIAAGSDVPFDATSDVVTFEFEVTNTGNVTLTDPITVTDTNIPATIGCGGVGLAPGASVICTTTWSPDQADIDAGSFTNSATAETIFGGTPVTSAPDSVIVLALQTPELATTKTFDRFEAPGGGPGSFQTGDIVFYNYLVENLGNVTVTGPVTISDNLVPSVSCPAGDILPGGTLTCIGQYTLTATDIQLGSVTNIASSTATGPGGPVTSPPTSETVPIDGVPALTITKAATTASFANVGDEIDYTYTVTNTSTGSSSPAFGNPINIEDDRIGTIACFTPTGANPDLTFGETVSCTASYTVTQADLDAVQAGSPNGFVTNNAFGRTTFAGTDVVSPPVGVTVEAAGAPGLLVAKSVVSGPSPADVGDTLTYQITSTNTGNVTLSSVDVSDPLIPVLTCTVGGVGVSLPATLAVGEALVCDGDYTVTQADVDAQSLENTATTSAFSPQGSPVTETTANTQPLVTPAPAFTVTKALAPGLPPDFQAVGETLDFVMTVANTGNVTLTGVEVTDSLVPGTCTVGTLDPGATDTSCVFTYTVTQADIDAGQVDNTATATTLPATPGATPISTTGSSSVPGPLRDPGVSLAKTETDASGGFGAVGATETYSFSVTNSGNVTLSSITISDPLTGFSCPIAALAPGAVATTCLNGDPLQADYTVTQADLDRGEIDNTVIIDGQTPGGAPVSGSDTLILPGPDQLPALSLVKVATAGAGYSAVGDTVAYDYTVTNSGNITLTTPITIADDRTTVTCPALPAVGLLPGATLTCTATDTITQADLDAGSVTNIATANVTQPVVPSPTYPGGSASVSSPPATETVTAGQAPSLAIEKRIAAGSDVPFDATSDVVTFEFEVTNTGNVTLTDPITVTDTNIPATIGCGGVGLAPGASVICTTTWSPDQADIDAGSFTNSATAETIFGGTPVTSAPDSVIVLALQTPELATTKTFDRFEAPGGGPGAFQTGDIVFYNYLVENLGNVTVTGPVTISDNLVPSVSCPAGDILPGGTLTCIGQYTLTATDIQLGSVTNIASSTATGPGGPVTSPPTSETVPIDGVPALTITKAATTASFANVGDEIDYTYTVTNTSTGSSSPAFGNPINIEDDRIGTIACFTPTGANPDLTFGETVSCTASYTVTQADLDAVQAGSPNGFVTNNAFGRTTFAGTDVVSPPVGVTVEAAGAPGLLVAKSVVSGPSPADAGDTLTYRITSTNTGNVTLSSVDVSDPLIPVLTCTVGGVGVSLPATLAVGEALVCDGDYTVTQADVDAQSLENTATTSAFSPQGSPVTETTANTQPLVTPAPAFTVTKALAPGLPPDFQAVGETLDFVMTVANTGNVTLTGVEVTDSLVPGTCTVGTLDPGATDTSCVFTYTVTQADIDAGQVDNTATATTLPATPGATPISTTGSSSVPGPLRDPGVSLAKSADLTSFAAPGETITYTYTIANAGNVTLPGPFDLTDDRIATIACDPLPVGGLPPGEDLTCLATDITSQDDVDAGEVVNVATLETTEPVGAGTLSVTATETVPADQTTSLDATKTVTVPDTTPGTIMTYTLTVANTGNVTLIPVGITDTLTLADSTVVALDAPFALQSGDTDTDGRISVGESWVYTAPFMITQAAIDAGGFQNVADVATETPGGDPVTDVADDGDDTDGNMTDDPTVTTIDPDPGFDAVKTIATTGAVTGDTVTFEIRAENTGNLTISGVTLADTLTDASGTPLTPDAVMLISGLTGGMLEPGGAAVWNVDYTLTQSDVDAGGIRNSATVSGDLPSGAPISDISDDGDDGDGNTEDDPTELLIAPINTITVLKTAGDVVRLGPTLVQVDFTIAVESTSNITQQDLVIEDDLAAFAAPGTVSSVTLDSFTGFDGTGGANSGYDGIGDINIADADVDLLPGNIGTIAFTVVLDTTSGSPASTNTVGVISDTVVVPVTSSAGIAPLEAPSLTVAKTANPADARVGETISYEITFTNEGVVAESGVTLVDQMPPALRYLPDSALFNGLPTPAPDVAGTTLRWTGITIAPAETISVTLNALLVDGPGEFTNTAFVLDSSGARISTVGRASVFVRPEAVFDCGDVIGKVFDDRNLNGYQDGPDAIAAAERAAISDQTFGTGKTPTAVSPDAFEDTEIPEPGLPRVKLATINGTVITTDQYGRFSVPCAELPDGTIGSNFMLKLDERTLPTGYQVTTENPRNIRLTAGTVAKLNFGAALADVVEIDVTRAAFAGDSSAPSAALVSGIDRLVARLGDTPSVVKLTYVRSDESREVARARLDRVERLLRQAWSARGRGRLVIEHTIVRVQ